MYLLVHYGPFCDQAIGPYTFPTAALDLLYGILSPPTPPQLVPASVLPAPVAPPPPGMGPFVAPTTAGPVVVGAMTLETAWDNWTSIGYAGVWPGTQAPASFFRIGHSLLALAAGLAAGLLVRRWAQRGQDEPRQTE
jgi:hypothetical protein